jgi:hypothetical protein
VLTLDWSRGVDGERYIEIIRPIPTSSEGRQFELRRETLGAYDKGKAGLVLEEQVLLVDAGSGEVYTKFIGSSFFVGQVLISRNPLPKLPFPSSFFGLGCRLTFHCFVNTTDCRAAMADPKVQRNKLINHLRGSIPPKWQNSKRQTVKHYYID